MSETAGERIRTLRRRLGLSQAQLTEGLPLAPSYISLIERGQRRPSHQVLTVLASRLGCKVEYLESGRKGPGADELEVELRFAELALRAGDAEAARKRFARVLSQAIAMNLVDISQDARWGLTRTDEALGDIEGAIRGLEVLTREPELKGSFSSTALARRLAHAHLECGEPTRGMEIAEAALARRSDPDEVDADERAELASTLVACYFERGELARAQRLASSVIEEAERGRSNRARAAAYWNAGVVAEGRGDLRKARAFTERALALYSEGDNARATATLRLNVAWLLLRSPDADVAAAEALLTRALAELAELGTAADVARAEVELARCRILQGEFTNAVEIAQRAVERLAGGRRLESARAEVVLARALLLEGAIDGAAERYRRAGEASDKAGASRQAAAVWRELADDLLAIGMIEEGVAAYRHAADAAGVPSAASPPVRGATSGPQSPYFLVDQSTQQ